jgi:hypothetical protein
MKFVLFAYETPEEMNRRNGPEAGAYWAAWNAYVQAIGQSGALTGGAGLQPPETTTAVRLRDGVRQVQDGPFADAKEELGGFFIVDLPNLDKALEWAARMPCAGAGSVQVRPVLEM